MIGKAIRLVVVLAVAGGIPYAWFSEGAPRLAREKFRSAWSYVSTSAKQTPESYAADPYSTRYGTHLISIDRPIRRADLTNGESAMPVAGTIAALEEVLRFDINDRWVVSRWPRVSTILSDNTRKGLRVPLVTGASVTDLAGSLSYYFDERGRVRRITFDGQTGDAHRLIDLATHRFSMRQEPSLGAGLYLTRWNALPTNGLFIRHAPVVRDSDPRSQLEVRFEINRPDAGYSLSHEFLQLLRLERRARGG
jgi:hypothetical protein